MITILKNLVMAYTKYASNLINLQVFNHILIPLSSVRRMQSVKSEEIPAHPTHAPSTREESSEKLRRDIAAMVASS